MTTALVILAIAFWGHAPACGVPTTLEADLPAPRVGWADLDKCTITLDSKRRRGAGWDCMVYLHEFGHFIVGPEHSNDPNSIMYYRQRPPHGPCRW